MFDQLHLVFGRLRECKFLLLVQLEAESLLMGERSDIRTTSWCSLIRSITFWNRPVAEYSLQSEVLSASSKKTRLLDVLAQNVLRKAEEHLAVFEICNRLDHIVFVVPQVRIEVDLLPMRVDSGKSAYPVV